MKRLFTALGITLALFFSISTSSFAQQGVIESDPLDLVTANAITSTVRIIFGTDRGFGGCSGVVIKNTPTKSIVLTAKHCLSFDGEMYVQSLEVSSVGTALKSDLAYVVLNEFIPNKTPIRLSNYLPKSGDKIVAIGFPGSNLYITKDSIFVQTPKEQYAWLEIISGCSGGGVYNTHGELIGIMVRHYPTLDISILVRLEDIHTLINVNRLLE